MLPGADFGRIPAPAVIKADFIQVYGVEARHWMLAYAGMTGKRSFPRKRESREPYTPLQTALGFETRFDVHAFLKAHEVPFYTLDDLQHDRETLRQLGV
jgi:hypothetical protein